MKFTKKAKVRSVETISQLEAMQGIRRQMAPAPKVFRSHKAYDRNRTKKELD